MMKKQTKGLLSELYASAYLLLCGYRIIARNKRINGVEIDVLTKKSSTLIAVEVKFRQSIDKAHVAIHPKQMERQLRAMHNYTEAHPQYEGCRIDAIFITPSFPYIEHIKDAYSL